MAVVLFTLLLKFSTALINVPQQTWSIVSGVIILFFGFITLFPTFWEKISVKLNLGGTSDNLLSKSAAKKTWVGDVFLGMALGPVFSSCSPTYFLILATVLPESLSRGILYLIAYALGLSLVLLLIAYIGQKFVKKIQWAANPKVWFKRGLGLLFVLVGILIMTGKDKELQTYLLNKGYFDITKIELRLLQATDTP